MGGSPVMYRLGWDRHQTHTRKMQNKRQDRGTLYDLRAQGTLLFDECEMLSGFIQTAFNPQLAHHWSTHERSMQGEATMRAVLKAGVEAGLEDRSASECSGCSTNEMGTWPMVYPIRQRNVAERPGVVSSTRKWCRRGEWGKELLLCSYRKRDSAKAPVPPTPVECVPEADPHASAKSSA